MYKLGRPAYRRFSYVAAGTALVVIVVLLATGYWFVIHKAPKSNYQNSNSPLHTHVSASQAQSLKVDQPFFNLSLPGPWQETSAHADGDYNSLQWNYTDKQSGNRWFRVYVDTIPQKLAVNYMLPLTVAGNQLQPGQISDNCTTFTQNATGNTSHDVSTPISQGTIEARWQGVDFICDNSHVSHQVAGAASTDGLNKVTLSGPSAGAHSYYFVYEDDNYKPDYSIFSSILSSFRAK